MVISVSEEQFRKFRPFSVITENHPLYMLHVHQVHVVYLYTLTTHIHQH